MHSQAETNKNCAPHRHIYIYHISEASTGVLVNKNITHISLAGLLICISCFRINIISIRFHMTHTILVNRVGIPPHLRNVKQKRTHSLTYTIKQEPKQY